MNVRPVPFFAAAVLLGATPASACPVCTSATGERVREGIFDDEFGDTLLAMVLPFLVVAAVVGLIHGGPPARSSREERRITSEGGDAGRTP